MKRRNALSLLGAAGLGAALPSWANPTPNSKNREGLLLKEGSFSLDGTRLRFYHPGIKKEFKTIAIADTHLFRDDERGRPYQQYSGRMAKAYNQTRHYLTGEATDPEKSLIAALNLAADKKAELVSLIGDIVSFPSEAAVDFVMEHMKKSGLRWVYTAGNHDWHYEGMEGSLADLRATWIQKRLRPLYQKDDPMMIVRELHGVRIVVLDNSNYQITEAQLDFFKNQLSYKQPVLLMVHIPLYAPGRSVGFGCGHPEWNAASDRNYELERRERWPASGHTAATMEFHRTVFSSPELIGVVAGHIHRPSLDIINGIPQVVSEANCVGACLEIEFHPTGTRRAPVG
ncbi:MAG TPA: metallophosphoesterase [Flavihumibacter sp.]|jgi:UDP-2,3-diacylglucosamine pyrophosphatase LpxH